MALVPETFPDQSFQPVSVVGFSHTFFGYSNSNTWMC